MVKSVVMRKRSPDARPRPRLDLDRVVQAAVGLLDDEGLDGLTTRRLAQRLGVHSPALYWYVRDKEELLDLVADAICAPALEASAALVADPSRGWRGRLESGMRVYRSVLRSHRDAPRLLAERPLRGPNRSRLADGAVGCVLEAGFPEAEAAMISLLLSDYIISVVSEELRFEGWNREGARSEPEERPVSGAKEYGHLARIGPHVATVRPEELFEVGLGLLLDGIERRLERLQAPETS